MASVTSTVSRTADRGMHRGFTPAATTCRSGQVVRRMVADAARWRVGRVFAGRRCGVRPGVACRRGGGAVYGARMLRSSALLLGLGRALGETIAVFLVVGRQDNQWPERLLALEPLARAGQTVTSKLGGSETSLAYGDPVHWGALLGLGLLLLATVSALSFAGSWLALRKVPRA